ncbi:MAG: endonuclease MutS2 [Bacillota bacterium]
MNERTLRVLEFQKIRDRLASYASSTLGRDRIEVLEPSTDPTAVMRDLQETSEARMICRAEEFPLKGLSDVRPSLRRVAIGSWLQPDELLSIADICRCSRQTQRFFRDRTETYPLLSEYAQGITVLRELEDLIDGAINEFGEIRDSASPRLRRIRQEVGTLQSRVRQRLNAIIRSSTLQKYLQEAIITIRNDRYVVPVKQEYRAQVPGIIHDQSASGATLFVEPMSVVEINNDLRRLLLEEEQEIERILLELSAEVAAVAEPLARNLEALGHLDFCLAKGKLSWEMRAVQPQVNDRGYLHLRDARHPLLDPATVVPITVYLGQDFNVLLITGPNTGGKTVTLKTIGLLTLMAQSGLHIPAAEGSEISVFEQVFADIGDEQSIEQSLSTFSSHMTNIVQITQKANAASLVLLDELGAGTDPAEGAALAMSIIDFLYNWGCRVVATTHYTELKSYAYQTRGVQNASVEFDVDSLRPTYRLTIGLPGKSNAFEIASRLGLDESMIAKARTYLTGDQLRVEDLIRQLEENRAVSEQERLAARQLRLRAEAAEAEAARQLRELERDKTQIRNQAKQEARAFLARQKQEVDQLIAELRSALQAAQTANVAQLNQAIEAARQQFRELGAEAAPDPVKVETRQDYSVADDREFQIGDSVLVKHLGQRGQLLSEPTESGDVQVQLGALRLSCNISQLEKLQPEQPKQPPRPLNLVNLSRTNLPLELDLRGQTVDEALLRVDKYLDDAAIAGRTQVSIIHGKGTGALRNAVRDFLKQHKGVASFRFGEAGEGGTGVTIAELKK